MGIDWPPFQGGDRLLDHSATEADIAAGRAAFVLRDDAGRPMGSPVRLGMPRLGFARDGNDRKVVVAIQMESAGEQVMIGVRHNNGTFSICSSEEFELTPRYLVFSRMPEFGIDAAELALSTSLTCARHDDVLGVQWKNGPALFIRHAVGQVVVEEVARLGKNPHAKALGSCNALFEVSFLDIDEVLDESVSLPEVQDMFKNKLPDGFGYREWNKGLTPHSTNK